MKRREVIIALTACILVAGCGKQEKPQTESTAASVPPAFSAEIPNIDIMPIPEARKKLKPGDEVVLSGKIMGTKHPFVEGRAAFILGDESTISVCTDGCPAPWDACCDKPEDRIAATATIMVQGEDGKVLSYGLKGVGGLKELAKVTVAGKVAPMSTTEAFIVNATAIKVISE